MGHWLFRDVDKEEWGFLRPLPAFPTKPNQKLCLMKKVSESQRNYVRIEVVRVYPTERLYDIAYVSVISYPWTKPTFTRSGEHYISEKKAREKFQELLREGYETVSCEDVWHVFL